MRYVRLFSSVALVALAFLVVQERNAQPALAVHHLAEISEVMSGFNGDPNVQYVEINQRLSSFQNQVARTRLTVFNADGSFNAVLLLVPSNVPNDGLDVKWLMGTTAFETAAGISANFTFPAGILPNAGMVCWGAPGVTPPANPNSWDATDPNQYVDCVSYGGVAFTGINPMSPSPSSFGAGDDVQSLTRTVHATFNLTNPWAKSNDATAFTLATPSPENNAGQVGSLVPPVGGVAELPDAAGAPLEAPDSSGLSVGLLAGIAAAAATGVAVLGCGAWLVLKRRRI